MNRWPTNPKCRGLPRVAPELTSSRTDGVWEEDLGATVCLCHVGARRHPSPFSPLESHSRAPLWLDRPPPSPIRDLWADALWPLTGTRLIALGSGLGHWRKAAQRQCTRSLASAHAGEGTCGRRRHSFCRHSALSLGLRSVLGNECLRVFPKGAWLMNAFVPPRATLSHWSAMNDWCTFGSRRRHVALEENSMF
jgi:hypothetical protein